MSKILILTSTENEKKQKLISLLKKNFQKKDTQIYLNQISDICLSLDNNNVSLKIKNTDIKNYNLVYFRGIPKQNIYTITTLALAMEALRVKYFDTLYSRSGPHRSKLGSLVVLASNAMPIPKTICFFDNDYSKHFNKLKNELNIPFVAKELSQQRGRGVYLINTIYDLKKLPKKSTDGGDYQYFFQKFIPKDHEYRLLVLGDKVGVWEEKVNNNDKEFRNNVAVGSAEVFFDATKTPKEIKKIAINSAKALGIQIGGVDIMLERGTNKPFIIEVNRGPGFTYDDQISPEFKALAHYLEKESK